MSVCIINREEIALISLLFSIIHSFIQYYCMASTDTEVDPGNIEMSRTRSLPHAHHSLVQCFSILIAH